MLIKNESHYPVMLRLKGKQCVVIGGGTVAARKLRTLCETGAAVTLIAPLCCKEVQEISRRFNVSLVYDAYKPAYIENAFLVIAATDDPSVNRRITQDAPCLCNNITEPQLSNFIVPSSFTQGEITIALATGGMPAFTRLLKKYLQRSVTPELAEFNDFLREQRQIVKEIPSTAAQRTAFWRSILQEDLLNLVTAGNILTAKEKVINAISSFRAQSQDGAR